MILAVALSAVVLFAYMFYQAKTVKPIPTDNIQTDNTNQNNINNIQNQNVLLNTSQIQKIDYITNENILASNDSTETLENDYVIATFKNSSLFSYKLKNYYRQDSELTNEIVDMVEQVYEGIYPFTLTFQNLSNSIALPNIFNYYSVKENNAITYVADAAIEGNPIRIKKTFAFGEDPYQLTNTVTIENLSEKDLSMYYSYFLGTGIGPYRTEKNSVREDATKAQYLIKGNGKSKVLLTGDIVKENIFSKLFGFGNGAKTNNVRYNIYEGQDKWVALNNRYFAIISSPAQSNAKFETMTFSKPVTNEYRNDFHVANLISEHNIKSGSSVVDTYSVYIGPKVRRIFQQEPAERHFFVQTGRALSEKDKEGAPRGAGRPLVSGRAGPGGPARLLLQQCDVVTFAVGRHFQVVDAGGVARKVEALRRACGQRTGRRALEELAGEDIVAAEGADPQP